MIYHITSDSQTSDGCISLAIMKQSHFVRRARLQPDIKGNDNGREYIKGLRNDIQWLPVCLSHFWMNYFPMQHISTTWLIDNMWKGLKFARTTFPSNYLLTFNVTQLRDGSDWLPDISNSYFPSEIWHVCWKRRWDDLGDVKVVWEFLCNFCIWLKLYF